MIGTAQPRRVGRGSPAFHTDSWLARKVAGILELAGIEINGVQPWDIQVHDRRFYRRAALQGTLGVGESYMDGWWDCDALDELVARVHKAQPYERLTSWPGFLLRAKSRLLNRQTRSRSVEVANEHYDLGNDLYCAMLDPRMQYTCAYWNRAGNLDEAQENKLHLICRKLHLQPGMTVLELGGGFGGLAHFMAAEYGCSVVSYNISHEQVEYARRLCSGLPVRVEERDYRECDGEPVKFDRVVAIGLCEHIGPRNYGRFFALARERLNGGGLFLLHTIGSNRSEWNTDAWIEKYIFPNGVLPSVAQLGNAASAGWIIEDLHNFGPDYDPTLMAWWENFDGAWPSLRAKYGDRFYRMWRYYLLASAGSFRARKMQLWQLVLSKGDIPRYECVR